MSVPSSHPVLDDGLSSKFVHTLQYLVYCPESNSWEETEIIDIALRTEELYWIRKCDASKEKALTIHAGAPIKSEWAGRSFGLQDHIVSKARLDRTGLHLQEQYLYVAM